MDLLSAAKEWDDDLPAVMKILARSNDVRDADGLLALITSEVADLLHHDAMVCGYHVISTEGNYVHNVLEYNYPAGYAEALAATEGRADSPLMRRWRETLEPVLFQSGRDDDKYPAEWVNIFKRFGLRNTIGHGILDVRGTFGSYFIFSRLPGEVGNREVFLLKLITPHLHFALMRTIAADQKFNKPAESGRGAISERQREILRWINQGKTNKEIAQLLSITEKNVKYHVEQIFTKLGVRSRAQAVSSAILLGLLE
jgi:LuxR family transcriptional regulator, quorum-sensing system regulator CviR